VTKGLQVQVVETHNPSGFMEHIKEKSSNLIVRRQAFKSIQVSMALSLLMYLRPGVEAQQIHLVLVKEIPLLPLLRIIQLVDVGVRLPIKDLLDSPIHLATLQGDQTTAADKMVVDRTAVDRISVQTHLTVVDLREDLQMALQVVTLVHRHGLIGHLSDLAAHHLVMGGLLAPLGRGPHSRLTDFTALLLDFPPKRHRTMLVQIAKVTAVRAILPEVTAIPLLTAITGISDS
jgi:hypothetical protein